MALSHHEVLGDGSSCCLQVANPHARTACYRRGDGSPSTVRRGEARLRCASSGGMERADLLRAGAYLPSVHLGKYVHDMKVALRGRQ